MGAYDPIYDVPRGRGVDYKWLGSRHGLENAKTYVYDASAFPEEDFPEGRVLGGQTLAVVNGKVVPFNAEGTDGSENFEGILAWDRNVSNGDDTCAVMWHGLVYKAFLPATAQVPTPGTGQITFK